MKRFAFAILLVMAVAVAVFLALNRPGAEASPGATITVNATVDWIEPNQVLTLSEAIMLADGELSLGDLLEGECHQVSGAVWGGMIGCYSLHPPGDGSADTIVFDTSLFPPGNPATITFPMFSRGLAGLFSGGDTVDGSSAGVVVDAEDQVDCFRIYSNDNVIKGLEIYNCRAYGVLIENGVGNIIGGSTAGEGNVISGNNGTGVFIKGGAGNVVKGNYIGTNADGTAAKPNSGGVVIIGGGQNIIGGSTAGDRNVISGNSVEGVVITGANGNTVEGNYIGTNADGTAAIPNYSGVEIHGDAQNNIIGATAAGEGNLIAFNDGDGVRVREADTTGNTIRGNSIHSNGGKGIENIDGGNTELEPPTIDSVGSVFGTACPDCIIDIYSDDEDEGRVYEGSTTADGDGNWSFPGTPGGPNITATATDSHGNTSEFSEPLEPPWPTPTASPTATATPTVSPTPVSDSDGDTVADDVEEALGSDPNDSDSTPEHAAMPGTCSDGVDNDGDGLADAEDEGCRATRTLVWGPGWHNVTWTGASTPEEALACAAGNYAAAYRLVSGGWERYFPDRPDLSNMTDFEQYSAFLILVTDDVTCEMPVAGAVGTERTLDWGVGWQNDGWPGADGSTPQDAFACADGSYAAAYRLVSGGWERYFPDRPDISNMGPLDEYDAFLILVTEPVSCTMAIAP
jgi:parallel beta-helix repeat protein